MLSSLPTSQKRPSEIHTSNSSIPFFSSSSSSLSIELDHHRNKSDLSRVSKRALLAFSDSIAHQIRIACGSGTLFKPGYRKNITNFVFVGAFVSACVCVGAQSLFPDSGFHSNYVKLHPLLKTPSSTEGDMDENQQIPLSASPPPQSLFCPAPFLRFFNIIGPSNKNLHTSRQRRWIQEETP
ncbi:hypothetical protein PCANC_20961 [Puccinia coronata f. sp. avenae]|uniref:Uncharacterized protein n=1 Tax=Puccinia coronata f. sp. avenae TaxID=200324 RepID=A0A2N5TKE9_9BASI|nr:hypothetical protein PCASD_21832 [Puccinia coronata f. sp. avenae]PLW31257.1 hypothetical protein PCANC_22892 [Puccinia coronata f. sp. avenae]PLW35130.1 hypothetical protein PCANC_20961 [Puccinia coronata f. sp. avenae]